jgi:uncharacterized protein YlxW (UPF0749 family)
MENIIVALITGGLALVGVIVTNVSSNRKIEQQLITGQAVTDTQIKNLDDKIADLTDEVRKHNSFADRITKLEVKVAELEKRAS